MDQLLTDPALQGQGHPADRDAGHRRADPAGDGQGPGELHRRRLRRRRSTSSQTAKSTPARSAASPATTTASGLASGDIAACVGLDRRRRPAAGRQPEPAATSLPAAGHMIWSDNFVIPNQAQHKKNAETADQLLLRPRGRWRRSRTTSTTSRRSRAPRGAGWPTTRTSPNNPLIFPSEEVLAEAHVFRGLTEDEETNTTGVPGPDRGVTGHDASPTPRTEPPAVPIRSRRPGDRVADQALRAPSPPSTTST